MHGDWLYIHWQDDNGEYSQSLKPIDIVTEKDAGEFLLLIDTRGTRYKIRLDKVLSFKVNRDL